MSDARNFVPSDIARQELRQFLRMAEQVGLDVERQCHALRIPRDDWQRWASVLQDAPMPSHPALPVVLRHIGYLTSRLDRAAQPAPDRSPRLPNTRGRARLVGDATESHRTAAA